MTRHLLCITPQPPWPMISGSTIRYYHLLRQLVDRGWRVTLFSLFSDNIPVGDRIAPLQEMCETVQLVPLAVPRPIRLAQMAKDVMTRSAYHRHYCWSKPAVGALHNLMGQASFDAVLFGTLLTFPYVPRALYGRAVLESQNVEYYRLQSMSASQPLIPRGLVARLQRPSVQRYETEIVRSVAMTLAVSEEEQHYFDDLAPGRSRLVPNGVDVDALQPRGSLPPEPTFLFMGSLSYSANVDALKYLVRDILPKVMRSDAVMTVVGSRPPSSVFAMAEQAPITTHVAGFVPSTRPYIEANRFLVVPLRVGGGTRLKILDALAQGMPVITTSVGCAGLNVEHLRDVIIADEPTEFARWIDRLLEDDELAARLAERGRQTVVQHYGWQQIGAMAHRSLVEVCAQGVNNA